MDIWMEYVMLKKLELWMKSISFKLQNEAGIRAEDDKQT